MDVESLLDEQPDFTPENKENLSRSPTVDLESEDGWEEDPNCFETLHARFAPSRRLNNSFFLEELAVSFNVSNKIHEEKLTNISFRIGMSRHF